MVKTKLSLHHHGFEESYQQLKEMFFLSYIFQGNKGT